ncbi:MAG: SAM-dependent methyltransferase, partial [Desulfocapsaceae bacterium]
QFVEKGVWRFGLYPDEVSNFLEPYGWKILEHLGYEKLAEEYLETTGRKLTALPIERIVLAGKI